MALTPPTTAIIVRPERGPDETFEQYKTRRSAVNKATDKYLRGTGDFRFTTDRRGMRVPYRKPTDEQ